MRSQTRIIHQVWGSRAQVWGIPETDNVENYERVFIVMDLQLVWVLDWLEYAKLRYSERRPV